MIEVTPDELLTMLGMKEAELIKLRLQVAALETELARLRSSAEAADGASANDH